MSRGHLLPALLFPYEYYMSGKHPLLTGAVALLMCCAGCRDIGHASRPHSVTGATLASCAQLPEQFTASNTVLMNARQVPAGELQVAGQPVGAHCVVTGKMHERISAVDGQTYAIGFEFRLPVNWNGRFLFQANGGLAGVLVPATGEISGGGALTHALAQGFAVISSDMGHSSQQNPLFGLDPQARLDYGHAAVAKLTPMAKALIRTAYGKEPDYSYLGGCSNGGRVAMVAAARYADLYDGFLAGDPGMNLPQAAAAQLYGAQQYARVATSDDLSTAFTLAERQWLANRILDKCDVLDGARDGMVSASRQCQQVFDLHRDAPRCSAERNGACLSDAQQTMLANVFTGARNSAGSAVYAAFPFDPGIIGSDWANWKFVASISNRDPIAVAFIFSSPPAATTVLQNPRAFALGYDMDRDAPGIFRSAAPYNDSAMSFMTPPDATRLHSLQQQGGKLLVFHGTADPVFSATDTARWYESLSATHGRSTDDMARYFEVPGMNHCRGGPATDQFDMLTALVEWVENDHAPERIIATARGAGNAGGVNAEVPEDWGAARSRPLCAYPKVASYNGSGDLNDARNFACR